MNKILIATFIAFSAWACGSSANLDNGKSRSISHYWKDYKKWYKTSHNNPITGDETRFLGGKHRGNEGYRVIYINSKGQAINQGKAPYTYPEGTVVVKEQYKDKMSYESGEKPELNIMIKMAAGQSTQTSDWGFVMGAMQEIHSGDSGKSKVLRWLS